MGFFNLPYLYGLLNAPFYLFFTNTSALVYSIFLLNILWISVTLILAFYVLKKTDDTETKFFLFAFAFVLSSYTYSLRPEIFILPFLLLLQISLDTYQRNKNRWWLPCLLTAAIGLMHPVGGFYAVFFILIYCIDNRIGLQKLLLLLAGTGIAVIVLYGPIVFYDIGLWKLNFFHRGFENDTRHIDLYYPLKFYSYSIPFFVLTVYNIWLSGKKEKSKEVLYLVICIALLLLFMRSYYLPYLFHFVFWRLSLRKNFLLNKGKRIAFGLAAFAGFFVCFGIPGYQVLENVAYRKVFINILDQARLTAERNNEKRIWVSTMLSMSVIDQPNSRLYLSNIEQLSGLKHIVDTGSIYLVTYKNDVNTIRHFNPAATDSIAVQQVYPPVRGLLRFGIQSARTDSLGLWMVTAVKK